MGDPEVIAERAMKAALSFLAEAVDEIAAMADGDLNALVAAAQIVRSRADEPMADRAGEHLAFSVITAAHTQLRTGERPEPPA